MRIIHVSDIHIRNFKYHSEYEQTFQELYSQMRDLGPDLVVNTGDTVHAKTSITPELVDMLARHVREVASIAPYRMILGNHDLNLKNPDRSDAISPVVGSLRAAGIDVQLWTTPGPHIIDGDRLDAAFYVYPINDEASYPTRSLIDACPYYCARIGLFHGSIRGCVTDADWSMDGLEYDLSLFDGLDFVMMGDIHRHQTWRDGRIAYAGSLIQQNFGESPDKGFLVWDIDDVDPTNFTVRHVPLRTPLVFHTISVGADFTHTKRDGIPPGSYVRVITESSFTSSEQRALVDSVRGMYDAKDVIVVNMSHSTPAVVLDTVRDSDGAIDFSESQTQETLLREYLAAKDMPTDEIERIVAIDRAIQAEISSDEDHALGSHWRINKIAWSNFCQYGRDNVIDMSRLNGVFGVFGQNNIGKSTIFELITEALFDRVTKDVPRNVDLINDDRDAATLVIDATIDGKDYIIERNIERVKRKDQRDGGKMSLDFYEADAEGGRGKLLNGDTRPETERAIRRLLGGFEEFCLTSMAPQHFVPGLPGGGDIINCKDTDRRRLLYRFLGLDVFEKKLALAKETLKATQLPAVSGDPEALRVEHEDLARRLSDCRASLEVLAREEADALETQARHQARIQALMSQEGMSDIDERSIDDADEMLAHVESMRRRVDRLEGDARRLRPELDSLRSELASTPEPEPVEDPTGRIRKEMSDLSSIEVSLAMVLSSQRAGQKKLAILQEVPCGDSFPTCKFLIDAFEARAKSSEVTREAASLTAIRDGLAGSLDALREQEASWRAYCAAAGRLDSLRRRATEKLGALVSAEAGLEEARSGLRQATADHERLLRLRKEIAELRVLRSELKHIRQFIAERRAEATRVSRIERDVSSREAIVGERLRVATMESERRRVAERDRSLLETYCQAIGKDGVPRSVLVEALPNISREINQIISSVSGKTVSLESDEEEQSLSLLVSSKTGRSRPVSLSGGAEKFIVSLAIRAALCRITSMPRSNMFIVDEGFGKLDPENSQAIQRMFQYLRGMFDHIVIVSHTETMRDMVDGTIDIGVDGDGYAHIEHI